MQHGSLVAIGGGSGAAQVLLGAAPFFARRTAIVAVTDTGRSSGVARVAGKIPAPGDLRATIAATARDPQALWPRLLEQRFRTPEHPSLDGMAFGNLLIAALTQLDGDFAAAVATVAALAGSDTDVLPASTANVQLCAELADGSVVHGEAQVRGLGKPAIARLFLDPAAPAYLPALAAIAEADLVVIGPGSFYTSLLATLQFDGIVAAIQASRAQLVFVANSTTQPGQSDGMTIVDHVARLSALLGPGHLHAALINRSANLDPAMLAQLAADGVYLLDPDDNEIAAIAALGVRPLVADYSERRPAKGQWNKQGSVRHDPAKLGTALAALLNESN